MKNILIIGLDDFNLSQLQALRHADEYRFNSLISHKAIKQGARFPVQEFLQEARKQLDAFDDAIDAIIGYWDFPVSTVLPILRHHCGLGGPSLEAVLKCEHKYWSRKQQAEVCPESIPPFEAVDPFDPQASDNVRLEFPFWIKPVKAASSYLGFKVHDRQELEQSLTTIRAGIGRFGDPFNYVLQFADLPAEIAAIDGNHCIAEGIISAGRQCTLEGYVQQGEVHVYGVVDSIREGLHQSSFSRYQYPSLFPEHVKQRMIDTTSRVLQHMDYDNSPFNIEFYWHEETDKIWLLEINTRISKSHCPLFKMVDGDYHHAVNIDVALGRKPDFPYREGPFNYAAKFMLRRHADMRVTRVPDNQDISAFKQRFPEAEVLLHITPGMDLADLRDQDSYSFETAAVFMGGNTVDELERNYQIALGMLPFEFESI